MEQPSITAAMPAGTAVYRNELKIDVWDLLRYLWRHWKLIFISLLVGALLMGGITELFMTPEYEATAKMYVLSSSDSVLNLSDLQLGTYLASDYQEVFKTHEVTNAVIRNLGLPYSYTRLQKMLTLTNPSGTRILNISIRSDDPQEAAAIANEYLKVASQYVFDVMLTDKPTELSAALAPTIPAGPSLTRNAVLGALIGVILSCAILLVAFLLDDKIKTADTITQLTGLPVLGQVPVYSVRKPEDGPSRRLSPERNDTV